MAVLMPTLFMAFSFLFKKHWVYPHAWSTVCWIVVKAIALRDEIRARHAELRK